MTSNRPVFINSGYRTGGTWLWAKFRRAPTTITYCDIFHEGLSVLDFKTAILSDRTWPSKREPAAPFWLEFLPLAAKEGGVRGYDSSMALERYIPEKGIEGELTPAETAYIDALIENARLCGKTPVICDTRTLGRMRATAKRFCGASVLLHRNLFHQWASCSQQFLTGNRYFIDTLNAIIRLSRHDPFVRMLDDWFSGRIASPYDEGMYLCFLLFHTYVYSQAFDTADVVVDITKIASNPDLRISTERALGSLVDSTIDLSDVRPAFGISVVEPVSGPAFFDTAAQFWKLLEPQIPSAEARAFGNEILQGALAEWERHEFWTNGIRSALVAKLEEAQGISTAYQDELQHAVKERDVLAQRLSVIQESETRLNLAAQTLKAESQQLSRQLAEAAEAQNALRREIVELSVEREETVKHRIDPLESALAQSDEKLRRAEQNEAKLKRALETAVRQLTNVKSSLDSANNENAAWQEARAFRPKGARPSFIFRLPPFSLLQQRKLLRGARAAMRKRDWSMAARDFHAALMINSDRPYVWVEYGHALKESGAHREASVAYRKVLLAIPDHPDMAHHLATVMRAIKAQEALNASSAVRQQEETSPPRQRPKLSFAPELPPQGLSMTGVALAEPDPQRQRELFHRDLYLAQPLYVD